MRCRRVTARAARACSAGRHSCIASGRWSARATGTSTCCAPSRALSRSTSSCSLSPLRLSSGRKLVLAPAQGEVSSERRRSQLAGAASVARARRSPIRRRRCAMSCVGCAVRTVMLLVRRQVDAVEAPQVERPFQLERQHAALARVQPDLQRAPAGGWPTTSARARPRPARAAPASGRTRRAA